MKAARGARARWCSVVAVVSGMARIPCRWGGAQGDAVECQSVAVIAISNAFRMQP